MARYNVLIFREGTIFGRKIVFYTRKFPIPQARFHVLDESYNLWLQQQLRAEAWLGRNHWHWMSLMPYQACMIRRQFFKSPMESWNVPCNWKFHAKSNWFQLSNNVWFHWNVHPPFWGPQVSEYTQLCCKSHLRISNQRFSHWRMEKYVTTQIPLHIHHLHLSSIPPLPDIALVTMPSMSRMDGVLRWQHQLMSWIKKKYLT